MIVKYQYFFELTASLINFDIICPTLKMQFWITRNICTLSRNARYVEVSTMYEMLLPSIQLNGNGETPRHPVNFQCSHGKNSHTCSSFPEGDYSKSTLWRNISPSKKGCNTPCSWKSVRLHLCFWQSKNSDYYISWQIYSEILSYMHDLIQITICKETLSVNWKIILSTKLHWQIVNILYEFFKRVWMCNN